MVVLLGAMAGARGAWEERYMHMSLLFQYMLELSSARPVIGLSMNQYIGIIHWNSMHIYIVELIVGGQFRVATITKSCSVHWPKSAVTSS